MRFSRRGARIAVALALLWAAPSAGQGVVADPENAVHMDLHHGRVVIELRPDLAPKTVTRFKDLVRQKFYDGLSFHRVLAGFMAQTGDPTGDGTGGSGQKLSPEFSNERHVRGTVSMARGNAPDSADSQFFICYRENDKLDGKYTIFGRVVSGMEYVDRIKKGSQALDGKVINNPDKIKQMRIAVDKN